MGFIIRAFSVLAGSEEFPFGSSDDSLRIIRSKTILTKSVQCIIDANQGWELDQDRNPTSTDYTDIPTRGGGTSRPGLFLRNSISGCKLFVSCFGSDAEYGIKNFGNNSIAVVQNDTRLTGLIFSMIPEDSTSEFGDPSTETFIPEDATRLYGTSPCFSVSYAYNPTNKYYYIYYFLVNPYCIAVYANFSYNEIDAPITFLYSPTFAVGRILESVAHGEENLSSKYGVLVFRQYSTSSESGSSVYTQTIAKTYGGSSAYITGTATSNSTGFNNTGCVVSKADGSWIGSSDNSHYRLMYFAMNANSLLFQQSSGNIAWSALGIQVYSDDLGTYGIVPNDGFKGVIDTTLFRAIADGVKGQTFDNNKFYCPENNKGLLVGWDSSNYDYMYIDLVLGLRWDPSNSTWLEETFDVDGDWWGGLQSSSDANKLSALGVNYSTNSSSSQWAGTVGSILYDTNHTFEIVELYSDMGTTPIEWDRNNFYIENNNPFRESGSDYNNRALLIASFNALNTEVMSWKVRIKKKKPLVDGVVYLSADKQSVTISSSFSQNVYDEDGNLIPLATIIEGGDRYIILNYYSSSDDISGSWDPKIYLYSLNGNLVLQNDSVSSVTIQRVTYRLVENPPPPPPQVVAGYFSSNKSPINLTMSYYYPVYDESGTQLKIAPEKSYLPKKYILSDESEIEIPSADATKTYFAMTSNQSPDLSIYHTLYNVINNVVSIVYESKPANLITAWVSDDKSAQTVGPWSVKFLYDESGSRIPIPQGLCVVAYYYVNGEKIYNDDIYVSMSDSSGKLRIGAKNDVLIEKVEYSVQPVPTM